MNAVAITRRVFRAPLKLITIAKTDSTNLHLYRHPGEVIFNWDCSVRELRVHHPETGEQHGIKGQGFLAIDQWHEISWEIQPGGMRVLVDGECRFSVEGAFGKIQAPLAIGPCFGGTVTVRSFEGETEYAAATGS